MSEYKCKGCQWYNKPYWSIINPCDNCPRENANIEIITRWQDPTIEELKTQLQQKENIIKEVREYIKTQIPIVKAEMGISNINTAISELLNYEKILEILDKVEE